PVLHDDGGVETRLTVELVPSTCDGDDVAGRRDTAAGRGRGTAVRSAGKVSDWGRTALLGEVRMGALSDLGRGRNRLDLGQELEAVEIEVLGDDPLRSDLVGHDAVELDVASAGRNRP